MHVGGFGIPGVDVTAIAKQAAMNAIKANPLVKQATEVVGPVKALVDPASPTSLGHLEQTLKTAVAETVNAKVSQSLAAAGVAPTATDPNAVADAASDAANAVSSEDPGNGGNSGNGEDMGGGGRRYEIVTLSSPIDEPLFVCYKSGKPVYFTNSSRGINILSMHNEMEARYKKPAKKSTKKRKATKKSSKKKLSRKRR
jgi:hypothetical protein